MTKILILGGISEAKQLALRLHKQNIPLIYSIQGEVRVPKVDFEVITGGFSQNHPARQVQTQEKNAEGLTRYLISHNITLVVDCTHPYAENISRKALQASLSAKVSCLQYTRPAWSIDNLRSAPWSLNIQELDSYEQLLQQTKNFSRPFWAIGLKSMASLIKNKPPSQEWVFRTAKKHSDSARNDEPKMTPGITPGITIVQQIGPFSLEHEYQLFKQKQIDALICKNSGGKINEAKLKAASELDIPVFLLKRPNKNAPKLHFSSIDALFNEIIARI